VLASAALHAALFASLTFGFALPPVDFELQLPPPVELGFVDVPPASPDAPPLSGSDVREHAGADAPQGAAAPPTRPNRREPPTAEVADVVPPQPVSLTDYAPPGALLALRLDVGRLRASSLAPDVGALLAAIPDWQAILAGSELDPLRDLERLYLASPDLRRSKLVVAGEYVGGEAMAREAAARLARSRGESVRWRKVSGIPVARWANADATERVVALIGKGRFVITRRDDLTRVLRIAAAQTRRPVSGARPGIAPSTDNLLALEPGALLALEVEGVGRFIRGNTRGVPARLAASVRSNDAGELHVLLDGEFGDAPSAARAKDYWARQRDRFAAHPLVAFAGMRPIFADARIELERETLRVNTRMNQQQARVMLGLIRGALTPPPSSEPREPLDRP
jgi:hypothetical protein